MPYKYNKTAKIYRVTFMYVSINKAVGVRSNGFVLHDIQHGEKSQHSAGFFYQSIAFLVN